MDKFLIAPIKSGLQKDLVPFLYPEDAFQELTNMIIHDGKITRHVARERIHGDESTDPYALSSRLRIKIGSTDGSGNFPATAMSATGAIGQQFTIGDHFFTVFQATGAMKVYPDDGPTGTFNVATRTVTITGANATTDIYFYPSQPVIHMNTFFKKDGDPILFFFDLENSYKLEETAGITHVSSNFNGNYDYKYYSEQFKSDTSGQSAFIVAGINQPIKYYDDTSLAFADWYPTTLNAVNFNVRSAESLISYKGRLLLLRTSEHEGSTTAIKHRNRIRYSEFGDIFNTDSWWQSPSASNKGGIIDLPPESIIKFAIIFNDRLIVFCENQIYELVSTGNTIAPFDVELIDDTMGSAAQSAIEVNNVLLFVNNFGLFAYDGKNIVKMSNILDDYINVYEFRFSGLFKDALMSLVYIPYSDTLKQRVPNRCLVYNYENNTFSILTDKYTSGAKTYYIQVGALAIPSVVVGNQCGYINRFVIDDPPYKNAPSQVITDINRINADTLELEIPNHLLKVNEYIRIDNSEIANLDGPYKVDDVVDDNTIYIDNADVTNYEGIGTISYINQIKIKTKEFNFYMKDGFESFINKVTFNLNKTEDDGEYTLATSSDSSTITQIEKTFTTTAYLLKISEAFQERIWHDVYIQLKGGSISFNIYLGDEAILDPNGVAPYQDLTINAIMIHANPAANF